jgi:HprK-related kinase A
MSAPISETSSDAFSAALAGPGLRLDLGAVSVRVRSDVAELAQAMQVVYGAYPFNDAQGVCDVTARLRRARGVRRFVRPQVELLIDGTIEFEPFPADTPLPLLEWGMNYALAQRSSWCLLLHAGVVERGGRAVVLPAMPGAGKSTLTAALTARGFRLLSDEFGVVAFSDSRMNPLLRPIALKNESIDVITSFAPGSVIGPRYPKTHKGTVAHLAPSHEDVAARAQRATPKLVIFPRFDPACRVEIEPVSKARAFGRLAVNSFNYEFLGARGFDALGRLMETSDAYQLRYGDLAGAIDTIGALLDGAAPTASH